ncbi:MAG: hypothetical protein JNL21_07320 [Myxococcales bacterium]|nr:hypothetical protein [Myxococcales bacterium]
MIAPELVRCIHHPVHGWNIPDPSNLGPAEPRKLYVDGAEMSYRLVDAIASGIDPDGLTAAIDRCGLADALEEPQAKEWRRYWTRLVDAHHRRIEQWRTYTSTMIRVQRLRRAAQDLSEARERGDVVTARAIGRAWCGLEAPPGSVLTTEIARPTSDVRRAAERLGVPHVGILSYRIGHGHRRRDIDEKLWLLEDVPLIQAEVEKIKEERLARAERRKVIAAERDAAAAATAKRIEEARALTRIDRIDDMSAMIDRRPKRRKVTMSVGSRYELILDD